MGEAVFRHYDQEALDREYNNRDKVADYEAYLAHYTDASARTRADLACRLDVAYGDHPNQVLDIFPAAAAAGPAPAQVFIHGGYWRALHKEEFSFVARGFVPKGAATVVIDYALMPGVEMDELVRQCRAALAWVWRNAASFGADPERIFISGHSAGGHLVAMLMATDWPAFAGLPADVVKGGCGISGLYDLEPIRLCYLNQDLHLDAEAARRNSPTLLAPVCPGPLMLPVGALEGPEYLRQSEDLAAAWRAHGREVEVRVMADHNHFTICAELEDPASELATAIQRQMGLG